MTDIATALTSAFRTGSAAPVTLDDLLTAGGHTDESWMVVVSVPLTGATPALPALFAGLGVSSHETLGAVPPALAGQLPTLADSVAVTQVDFALIPSARHVTSIVVTASLSRTATALTLGGVTIQVKDLVLRIDEPLSADRAVTLIAHGGVNIANTPLANIAFELTLPECDLQLRVVDQSQPVDIDALLAAAGIATDLFKGYVLTELDFDADVLNRTLSMDVAIANANPAALLKPNAGFGLDSITVSASFGSGGTSASLAAQLSYAGATGDPLLFHASASYTPGDKGAAGTWILTADCTGAGTGKLTLPTILEAVGIPAAGLPIGLDKIEVDLLQAGATLGGGSNDYTFAAAFDTHLAIDSTTIDGSLSFDIDWATGGKASGSFEVDIDVDGFAVKLSDKFGSDGDTITVSASYDNFTIKGTYTSSTGKFALTASLTSDATLGSLLAEVIGCVTGNAQHRLPPPFDLVDDIKLSSLVSAFEVDFTPATNSFALKLNLNLDLGICQVSAVELDYARGTPGKTSGFSVKLDYTVIGETGSVNFDPTAGSSAPLPDTGLPLLQINSAVAGQNVTLPGSPSDVTTALAAAVAPLLPSQPQSAPVVLPAFSAGGWVLGADLLIKQQVQLRFIFDDPDFYGAALTIKAASSGGGSAYLAPLVGLDAEISYHRISDTNGVYSATISLPPLNPGGGGSVQLPLCSVQLPRIAVQIYTDGDFLVDLGFPYGLDFSNSLSVHLEEFVGSGGVYFGRLSGADQPSLPDAPQGYVGTVTEIGVGMQIGIYYGESFGPLSGSLSITAQGLFEGTFAEIVVGGSSTEYYDIVAAVSVSGALQAELNFFIISASLYVGINVSAQVTAIWHQPVDIVVDASIDVELEAEINLGFFSISKSFSFSATISDSFTISSGDSATLLLAAPAPQPVSLAGCFEKCPLKAAVGVWVTPVLTLAAPGQWAYVLDFAVPLAPPPPAQTPAPFTTLTELVLGWFVYAWMKNAGTNPQSPTYDTLVIDAADLATLAGTIQAMTSDATTYGFTADDLAWLVANSLTVDLTEVQGTGAPGVAAFPLLPQTIWRFGPHAMPDNPTADALARDYFLLVAHAAIAYARDLLEAAKITAAQSVTQLMALLSQGSTPKLGDVAGMTTRFMMHGVHVGAGDTRQPAYVAAGLTQTFDPGAVTAISYEVAPVNGNALSISSASSPPSKSLFTPAQVHGFAGGPQIAAASWQLLPLTTEAPHLFISRSVSTLTTSAGAAAGSLWRLPKALAGELEQRGPQARFLAGTPPAQGAIDPTTVPVLDHKIYSFAAVISVTIGRGAAPASGAQVYPIHAIRGRSAAELSDLIDDLLGNAPPGIAQVELVYRSAAATGTQPATMAAIPVDASLFVYVQNLSSQVSPNGAQGSTAAIGDPAKDLLYALQARSLTSRGGFYLAIGALAKGLPDAAFDGDVATVSVVVSFTPQNDGTDTLKAYHNGLRSTAPAGTALAVWTPAIEQSRRNFMPGVFGFELELDFEDPADNSQYGQTLNQLFHLAALAPVVAGGEAPPIDLRTAPLITSPTANTPTTNPAGTKRFYRRTINVFDYGKHASPYVSLRQSRLQLPTDPDEAQDPYALVGATVDIAQSQVLDMFGNTLPLATSLSATLKPIEIVWTDELEAIDRWPGLTTRYRIEAGDLGPVLTLLLDWTGPDGMDDATATRLLQRYTAIFFQLARSDLSVTSTLLDNAAWPMPDGQTLAQQLQAQVKSILLAIAGRTTYSGEIALGVASPASVRTDMVFPLAVDLTQALSASVPVGGADRRGFTVTSSVYPDLWAQAHGASATRASPFSFAAALEAAFASGSCQRDFKLMSGHVDEAGNPTYWLLRYGIDGFSLSFAAPASPASAAPPPLATQALDRPSSKAGTGGPTGPLDVDASLRRALDALETVLRPEVALSPGVGTNWSTAQSAKWSLAQNLSSLVLDTQTGAAASSVATEAYRQAMLKDARAFYTVDGTIAYDVAATMGSGQASAIAVYGAFGTEGAHPPASFSPASVVLSRNGNGAPAAGAIATCFTVHDAGAAPTLAGPTQFSIRALRIALRPVSVPPAWFAAAKAKSLEVAPAPPFLDGSWLHFVIPPAPIAVPARTVAVPLRALPVPPVATAQTISTPVDAATPGVSLEDLKRWNLGGTLQRRWVAQDTLEVLIEANVPPTGVKADPAPVPASLAQALADFEAAWPANAAVIAGIAAGKAPAGAAAAVLQIGQQLGAIATAAAAGPVDPPLPLPAQVAAAFLVDEGPDATDATRWAVTVTPDVARSKLSRSGSLAVAIANMDATKSMSEDVTTFVYERLGAPVGATDALADTERTLSFTDAFDVIGAQSGRISYSTLRNRTLAPPFRYATAPIGLPKPLLPHVAHDTFFDIATLAGSSELQPLSELIEDYLLTLLATDLAGAAPLGLQITLQVSYPLIAGDHTLPMVSHPIGFLTTQTVAINPQAPDLAPLVNALTAQVAEWAKPLGRFAPDQAPWQGMWIQLATTVYAAWEGSATVPLLSLGGPSIAMSRLKWLA